LAFAELQAGPVPASKAASALDSAPEEAGEGGLNSYWNPSTGQLAEDFEEEEEEGGIGNICHPKLTDEQFDRLEGHFRETGIDLNKVGKAKLIRLAVEVAQQLGIATMEQMFPGELQPAIDPLPLYS